MDGLLERIHALIGCDWGRKITADADLGRCDAQAVQRMEIRDRATGRLFALQFCARHLEMATEMTNPRAS